MLLKSLEASGGLDGKNPMAFGNECYVSSVSAEMRPLHKLITEIAPTEIPVLLIGESGTGKEITAFQIHRLSKHNELPFVKLSCAALTQECFQTPSPSLGTRQHLRSGNPAGTLFFDEISELDANCQRYFLHSFPEGNSTSLDDYLRGRILSCTSRDLDATVQSGHFRSDLYYRLNGVCLRIPPLRQRKEDIPILVQFFLRKYACLFNRAQMSLTARTIRTLIDYSWPGNIRELENVVKKIVAVEDEDLGISDLRIRPTEARVRESGSFGCSLKAAARAASQQTERELILQTLARTHWNRKRAAEALQISYKALLYKLKQIEVAGPDQA